MTHERKPNKVETTRSDAVQQFISFDENTMLKKMLMKALLPNTKCIEESWNNKNEWANYASDASLKLLRELKAGELPTWKQFCFRICSLRHEVQNSIDMFSRTSSTAPDAGLLRERYREMGTIVSEEKSSPYRDQYKPLLSRLLALEEEKAKGGLPDLVIQEEFGTYKNYDSLKEEKANSEQYHTKTFQFFKNEKLLSEVTIYEMQGKSRRLRSYLIFNHMNTSELVERDFFGTDIECQKLYEQLNDGSLTLENRHAFCSVVAKLEWHFAQASPAKRGSKGAADIGFKAFIPLQEKLPVSRDFMNMVTPYSNLSGGEAEVNHEIFYTSYSIISQLFKTNEVAIEKHRERLPARFKQPDFPNNQNLIPCGNFPTVLLLVSNNGWAIRPSIHRSQAMRLRLHYHGHNYAVERRGEQAQQYLEKYLRLENIHKLNALKKHNYVLFEVLWYQVHCTEYGDSYLDYMHDANEAPRLHTEFLDFLNKASLNDLEKISDERHSYEEILIFIEKMSSLERAKINEEQYNFQYTIGLIRNKGVDGVKKLIADAAKEHVSTQAENDSTKLAEFKNDANVQLGGLKTTFFSNAQQAIDEVKPKFSASPHNASQENLFLMCLYYLKVADIHKVNALKKHQYVLFKTLWHQIHCAEYGNSDFDYLYDLKKSPMLYRGFLDFLNNTSLEDIKRISDKPDVYEEISIRIEKNAFTGVNH